MQAENQTAAVEEDGNKTGAAPQEAGENTPNDSAESPIEAAQAIVDAGVTALMEDSPNESSLNEANAVSADEFLPFEPEQAPNEAEDARLKAVIEAIIYVTDEPLSLDQMCAALEQPRDRVTGLLERLAAEYEQPDRGFSIREVAGGYKLSTKPEHHDAVRRFVKNLKPPLKLSLPALETLAVIAYKQPITAPEIMEIRGVQGAGVLKTLLDRKVIATAGRKNVVGKPILYKTTREFLVQFGLKDLTELPTLKEFQEIGRLDMEGAAANETAAAPPNEPVEMPRREPPDEDPQPVEEPPTEPDQPAEPEQVQ